MKNMIIVGASSGIGEALAMESAKKGYNLILCARRLDKLNAVKAKIEQELSGKSWQPTIIVGELDVTDSTEVLYKKIQAWNEQIQGINYFVLNAGIEEQSKVGVLDTVNDEAMININFAGVVRCNEVAVKILTDNSKNDINNHVKKTENLFSKVTKTLIDNSRHLGESVYQKVNSVSNSLSYKVFDGEIDVIGNIMVTSSVSAYVPLQTNPVYAATKSAVSHYFEGIRGTLIKKGIVVTVVHPGFIETPMTAGLEKRFPKKLIADVNETATAMLAAMEANEHSVIVPEKLWKRFAMVYSYLPARVKRLLPT